MDTHDLEARLGEYLQQLALLNQEDIREPNQSLILDFFCIDEEFTDFLRMEVFCDSASRYKTWLHINTRETDPKDQVTVEHLLYLLDYKNSEVKEIWANIVSFTAKQQNNIGSLGKLSELFSCADDKNESLINSEANSVNTPENASAEIQREITRSKDISITTSQVNDKQSLSKKIDQKSIVSQNLLVAAGGFVFLAVIIMIGVSSTILSTSDSTNPSTDDKAVLEKLENDAKDAILICEHRPIIERANSLSLSDQSLMDRKDKIISEANKSIAFLDQSSSTGSKYWEDGSCTWGQQWFDKHTESEFRAFITVSKKCINPVIHYGMTKTKDASDITLIEKGQLRLGAFDKGEVKLPYLGDSGYGTIEKVSCSG